MSRKKEIMTGAGVLACAIAIGFVMQQSDKAAKLYGEGSEFASFGKATPDIPIKELKSDVMLSVEGITFTSAEFDTPIDLPSTQARVTTASAPQSILRPPQPPALLTSETLPSCTIAADARPVAAAMVEVGLRAFCLPNERVTVHHNGMIFTETTSPKGTLDLTVPALAADAVFVFAFTNGAGSIARTDVEDLDDFDRVVLQWKGDTGFQIHAREFGAAYNSEGHIWEGAPGDTVDTVTGRHGMLTRYGDTDAAEPLLAEVYTFPKAATARTGDIALSVETEISDANCGVEIEAQSLQMIAGGQIKTRDITLPVPDCDAVGSFLVLNNLLQDLKVAQN